VKTKILKLEMLAGIALTAIALCLHLIAVTSAGGLWRDEANTVGLATLPRMADIWANLQFDSFPLLWIAIVRIFSQLAGPYNDSAFRALGFTIGVGVIIALWVNARAFGYRVPLFGLALFAVCPSVIKWGDSLRAYGLAMLMIFFMGASVWRFSDRPTRLRFLCAVCVAILGVQTVYYNAVVLVAFCAGGVAVAAFKRRWDVAGWVIMIGVLAAISLAPYWTIIRAASSWNALVRIPDYTFEWFSIKVLETLAPGGFWTLIAWISAMFIALAVGIGVAANFNRFNPSPHQRAAALFSSVTLVVGTVGSFLFLRELSYYTQPWYYLTLLTVVAFCIDVLLSSLPLAANDGLVRVAVVLFVGFATAASGITSLNYRFTNADIVAATVGRVARAGDIILVNPWYYGVTFDRYYRGQAKWLTVPDIDYHRFHRYDLVLQASTSTDRESGVSSDITDAQAALKRGNSVFLVGSFPAMMGGASPSPDPGAVPTTGDQITRAEWSASVDSSLRHFGSVQQLPVRSSARFSNYENLRVSVLRGWKE
jgi:hypothetical protein